MSAAVSAALADTMVPSADARSPEPAAPTDAPALGWTATVLAISALFLLVFNAQSLSIWLGDKEPTPAVLQARAAADEWTAVTELLRLDRPHALVRQIWERRKSVRWPQR